MQAREKIMLVVLLIISIISGARYVMSNFSLAADDEELPLYQMQDLTKFIVGNELPALTAIDLEDGTVENFFNQETEEIEITLVEPMLNEIIAGPIGYAATINGNFYMENEYVGNYLIKKINKDHVVLEMDDKTITIKRK